LRGPTSKGGWGRKGKGGREARSGGGNRYKEEWKGMGERREKVGEKGKREEKEEVVEER